MDAPHTVPQSAISAVEVEAFRRARGVGAPADQTETTQNLNSCDLSESHMAPGSVGVDVPGVGHVWPTVPSDFARRCLIDDRPLYRHELAIQRLLDAAESLARKNLGYRADWLITGEMIFGCNECGEAQSSSLQGIAHKDTCNTGRVLRLVRDFSRAFQNSQVNPEEKEAVPERGTSAAELRREDGVEGNGRTDDGIRLRANFDEPWRIEGYKGWNLGSNSAMFFIGDGAAQVYELKGSLPNVRRAVERLIACVNACAGIPTAELDEVTRIFEANPAYFSVVKNESRKGGAR